jgi:hypothetical protein
MVLDAFPVFFQQEKNKEYGSSPLYQGQSVLFFIGKHCGRKSRFSIMWLSPEWFFVIVKKNDFCLFLLRIL